MPVLVFAKRAVFLVGVLEINVGFFTRLGGDNDCEVDDDDECVC